MPIDDIALENLRRLGSDKEPNFLQRIIKIYLSSTKENLEKMIKAFTSNDIDLLTRTAHTIKSSSGNVGAMTLMKHCDELEMNCRHNRLDNTDKLIESISKDFLDVKTYLENI
jgi:HPt (histidine-containing phosphotransfer) domain-containing protein